MVDVPGRKSETRTSHHSLFGHPAGIEISCGDSHRWTSSAYDSSGNLLDDDDDDRVIVTPSIGAMNHSRWASRIFDSFQDTCTSCENVLTMLLAKRVLNSENIKTTVPDIDVPSDEICVLHLKDTKTTKRSNRRSILSSDTSYTSTLHTTATLSERPCLRVTSFMTPRPRLSPDRVLSCDDADDNDNNDSNIEKSRDLELIETIR